MPDSLRQLIEERIRQVPEPLARALETASCVGQSFAVEPLAQILEIDVERLEEMLLMYRESTDPQ